MPSHQRQLSQPPATVLEAVDEAAQMWGAGWQPTDQGGQLRLPVVQGLRRGIVQGTLSAASEDTGTSLRFDVEETSYTINRSAIAILLLGGIGGLTIVFWPLSPMVLQFAPIGAVLALVAWLMVVSRLRNSDAEDFFDLVADLSEQL